MKRTIPTTASDSTVSTQAQHTPGPWVVRYSRQGYPYEIAAPNDRNKPGAVGSPVRWAGIGFPSSPTALANARLIAAAPELLVALSRLLNDSMYKDHPEASQMAIDAIAKAEGR